MISGARDAPDAITDDGQSVLAIDNEEVFIALWMLLMGATCGRECERRGYFLCRRTILFAQSIYSSFHQILSTWFVFYFVTFFLGLLTGCLWHDPPTP